MGTPILQLSLAFALAGAATAQSDGSFAIYRATFDATWSEATHPGTYPSGAHFSGPVGATHVAGHHFWEEGGIASPGMELMAEIGSKATLLQEVDVAIQAGLAADPIDRTGWVAPGERAFNFRVTKEFPAVTVVAMVAPSPDWFIGVDGVELFQGGRWVDSITVPLVVWDAGTDSGANFNSGNQNTNPQDPIALQDGGPFFAGGPALGTLTIERKRSSLVFGSGINPAGSLTVEGEPQLGNELTITLDDPTANTPVGTPTILVASPVAPTNFPSGRVLPGFGLGGGPGELLVGAPFARIAGPDYLGVPVEHQYVLPTDPGLVGSHLYLQGVFLRPGAIGLTEALEVRLGV